MRAVIETETTVEVVPTFGPEHVLEAKCWCFNTTKHYQKDLVVHNTYSTN